MRRQRGQHLLVVHAVPLRLFFKAADALIDARRLIAQALIVAVPIGFAHVRLFLKGLHIPVKLSHGLLHPVLLVSLPLSRKA